MAHRGTPAWSEERGRMQFPIPTFDLEHIHSRLIGNVFSYWYYQGWLPPLYYELLSVYSQDKWEKG